MCCGEPFVELVAGSTDAATEKHVPFVTREGGKIIAKVGEVDHPSWTPTTSSSSPWRPMTASRSRSCIRARLPVAEFACDGAEERHRFTSTATCTASGRPRSRPLGAYRSITD